MNEAARSLLGEPAKEITLQEWPRVFGLYATDGKAPFDPDNLPPVRAHRQLQEIHAENMLLRSKVDGGEHRISMSAAPILSGNGSLEGVATLIENLSVSGQPTSPPDRQDRQADGFNRFSDFLSAGVDDANRIAASVAALTSEIIGDLSAVALVEPGTAKLNLVSFHDVNHTAADHFKELVSDSIDYEMEADLEGLVMATAAPVLVAATDQTEAPRSRMFGEFIRQQEIPSILMVPLVGRSGPIGAITLLRRRGGQPYTGSDRSFLMDVAGRTALAIENCMLFDSLQAEISARLTAAQALDLSEERFKSIFESTSLGIKILDLSGSILQTNAAFQHIIGYSDHEIIGRRFYDFLHPADMVRAVSVFQKMKKDGASAVRFQHRAIHKNGSTVWMNAIFSAVRKGGGNQSLAFIVSILEDVTEQKNFESEMTELKHRLQSTMELERLRLAHELHDGPMQDLYTVVYELEELRSKADDARFSESLSHIGESIHAILNELRETATELRPPTISEFGLEKTIRSYVADLQDKHPELSMHLSLAHDHQLLPEEVRLALFRVLQQSLTNILRHANATQIRIRFSFDAEEARLEVSDNGRGFQVPPTWIEFVREGHYGLAGAAERVSALGGIFVVESQPTLSTTVRAAIPWKEHLG
jgi:PAS domain S-box-containing protein